MSDGDNPMVEPAIPTVDEIQQLPRWAQVAFAARCARQVLYLYKQSWLSAPGRYLRSLDRAVCVAESAAARAVAADVAAADAAAAANTAAAAAFTLSHAAAHAADAAAAAARAAAVDAANTDAVAARATAAAHVWEAQKLAGWAAAEAGEQVRVNVQHGIRRDFDHLLTFSRNLSWTDSTPVPPTVFDIQDDPTLRFNISAFVRADVTADVIERDLVELYRAVNDYHIARGGSGLTLDQFRWLVQASVPAGV